MARVFVCVCLRVCRCVFRMGRIFDLKFRIFEHLPATE